jgi:hypothetical protein
MHVNYIKQTSWELLETLRQRHQAKQAGNCWRPYVNDIKPNKLGTAGNFTSTTSSQQLGTAGNCA